MKKLLVALLVIVAAYFAWERFRPPTLAGRTLGEDERVSFVAASGRVSIADHLEKKTLTLFLFTTPASAEGKDLETRLERVVRQRVSTVHLVIMDVGGLDTEAAEGLHLTRIPSAWLFDGFRKKTDNLEEIVKLLGV